MKTIGWSVASLSLSVFVIAAAGSAAAAPAKKAGAASTKAAPSASNEEVTKLKGDFKWGMTPDEVMAKTVERIEASYEDRLKKTINDPTKQDRVRKEMLAEVEQLKKNSLIKFDGQKSGYDVSIIDQEFNHGANNSMLIGKDANASRYFFFVSNALYKMYIAFDKDIMAGKDFRQFGQLMQARFGKAREVFVEEKSKAGVTRKLDHFEWTAKGGDVIRLVDRSSFYDVYCLVIADGAEAARQAEIHKAKSRMDRSDALVDSVTSSKSGGRDSNDNVIDRIAGKTMYRPGDEPPPPDIRVPSPVKAPTPAEVNQADPGATPKDKPAKAK